jgi:acylphosphatase
MAITRARFVVRGLVQGVNFRAMTAREAAKRRVTGRVWNREDGAVGIIAEGEKDAIDEFERWLKVGPRLAEVESVERQDSAGERSYQEFSVSYGPAS